VCFTNYCRFSIINAREKPQHKKRAKEDDCVARTIGTGNQDLKVIRNENYSYIDRIRFMKELWENGDSVTLITRPGRFGKTLTGAKLKSLHGTCPVISLSSANIKESNYAAACRKICQNLSNLYSQYNFF